MKDIEFERAIWGDSKIMLGNSQWDNGAERSVGYAWPDRNGEFSRGSTVEMPTGAFSQLVLFALERRYLRWEMIREAIRELDEE